MKGIQVLLAGSMLVLGATSVIAQSPVDFTASGSTKLVIIDGDGDGPDNDDCYFTANLLASSITITGHSGSNPFPKGCQMQFFGSEFHGQDTSSDFIGAQLDSATGGTASTLPILAEYVDEQTSPSGLPAALDSHDDHFEVRRAVGGEVLGTGTMCLAGGNPAVVGSSQGGVPFMREASIYPNSSNPQYLQIGDLPLQTNQGHSFFDVYVPITSNQDMTLEVDPAGPTSLLQIALPQLPPCSRSAAPTMSQWTVLGMSLALLVSGTWVLGRREKFRGAMPIV